MSRVTFSKKDLLSSNLELPSIAYLAPIFKNRKFKLELLPYKEGEIRLFKASYNSYNYYSTNLKWPINTSNLNIHFKSKHFNIDSSNNNNNIEEDLDNISNIDYSTSTTSNNTLNSYFKNTNIKKRPSFIFFSKEEYKTNLLNFIISNNLPLSIVIVKLKYIKLYNLKI